MLLLILLPLFWGWMGEWVGWWNGAIWDDLSLWSCPLPVGYMDRPLSTWEYGRLGIGTSPFPSPIVRQFAQSDAFHGYKVCVLQQAH